MWSGPTSRALKPPWYLEIPVSCFPSRWLPVQDVQLRRPAWLSPRVIGTRRFRVSKMHLLLVQRSYEAWPMTQINHE